MAMTNIIAAVANHTVTNNMMRLFISATSFTLGRDKTAPPVSYNATTLARGRY